MNDSKMSNLPFYFEIENNSLLIYKDQKDKRLDKLFMEFHVLNLLFPCENSTCIIPKFTEYLKNSDRDEKDIEIYKKELREIKSKLPKEKGIEFCLILQFKGKILYIFIIINKYKFFVLL